MNRQIEIINKTVPIITKKGFCKNMVQQFKTSIAMDNTSIIISWMMPETPEKKETDSCTSAWNIKMGSVAFAAPSVDGAAVV